jgi:hypothetical protein
MILCGRRDHLAGPVQIRFISPGRTGHPPRRRSSWNGSATRLGWSLVLPGDFGNETALDVTRFFKRLCVEARRNSVHEFESFRNAAPLGPLMKRGPNDIIGGIFLIVPRIGPEFCRLVAGRFAFDVGAEYPAKI